MTKLVHFEIIGRDSAALASFYARQFGYSADPSPFVPDYHLLKADDGGVSGAVMPRTNKDQTVILWFEVADLDASLDAIVAAGGAVAGERNEIPGEGHVQYAADPEGNIIGLKQPLL